MATIPTSDQIRELILDIIRQKKPRPGENVLTMADLQIRLIDQGLRADEIHPVLESMLDDGLFELGAGGRMLRLTEQGYKIL